MLAVLAVLLLVMVVPPLVSIGRYKSRITQLMSASLGRPVRLSSVSLRLLPWPGFELTDLSVDEDPAYGAEPVLHANSVTASFGLLALWRGRLQISSISMDEASLNLVRSAAGRWNLDPLFRTAAGAGAKGGRHALHLPYLEATNSRINIKNGVEKLPFSLLNTDFSMWQESSGEWRIRLRGEPTRTDLSQEGSYTGTVELEASARPAPALRRMPVHLDLEWREAQLGQLTRLMIGSDPGWRGDLTAELHLDGTADAAQITARLEATGVHRAEFAPAEPLDFDARCGLIYHYSERSVEKLACDSPLGDGSVHLAGELPGDAEPKLIVALNRIPVQAALDALRTVRSGIGPGLVATGTVSGKIEYAGVAPEAKAAGAASGQPVKSKSPAAAMEKQSAAAQGPISGSLTVENFALSGDGLRQPIRVAKLTLEPVMAPRGKQGVPEQPAALTANLAIPAGGAQPLTLAMRLTLHGYRLSVRGQAAVGRARELARVAGMADSAVVDALAGDPVAVDLTAEGPWLPVERNPFAAPVSPAAALAAATADADSGRPSDDSLTGTVTLRDANWKADYLNSHVLLAQAVLHLNRYGDSGNLRWDPVVFSYGPVKGTASLTLPVACPGPEPCLPEFQIQLGDVEAGALQSAFLGAHERGTLLATLLDRLHTASAPAWPRLEGTVKADSLALGPVTLLEASAALKIEPTSVEITSLDAGLLGGRLHLSGSFGIPQSDQDKPVYTLDAQCTKLKPAAVGALLGERWSGAGLYLAGKVELSGYTGKDLARSAKGALHLDWKHGSVSGGSGAAAAPAELARFDEWTADAAIANGDLKVGQSQVKRGGRKRAVEATLTLGEPVRLVFAQAQAKRR